MVCGHWLQLEFWDWGIGISAYGFRTGKSDNEGLKLLRKESSRVNFGGTINAVLHLFETKKNSSVTLY